MCDKHPESKRWADGRCAECRRAYQRAHYEQNKDKRRAYRERNKDKDRATNRAWRYGLTKEQAALVDTWPTCNICQIALVTGQGATGRHLDHDHNTGELRGILCSHCNKALGGFRDDPALLLRAVEYLTKPETRMRVANFTQTVT